MINIIKAKDRHYNDMGWLQTYWLFSFSSYHDPENISHGALRVFNDDVVLPHRGFETHPHEEMEIISIILDGEMTHKDTMGNETVIRKNDVQRMTAGTGLFHSEKNQSDRPVHFYQIWIKPDKNGLTPSYDQRSFDPAAWEDNLALLASDQTGKNRVTLNTEASVYRAALHKGKTIDHHLTGDLRTFIYLISGSADLNGHPLNKNDQARIHDTDRITVTATEDTDLILIDVPA